MNMRIAPAFITLVVAGCSMLNDYHIRGSTRQTVDLDGVRRVVIECYCEETVAIGFADTNEVQLDIVGALSSVGYHGSQSKPATVPREMLTFSALRQGEGLTLSSKEYTYIHHAFVIEDLRVLLPRGTEVVVHPLKWGELEGRE